MIIWLNFSIQDTFINFHFVITIFFSRYLVTFSPHVDPRAEEPQSIIIWDTRSGQKKRAFNAERPPLLPVFKWSNDDRYFARIGEDMLSVYETPVSNFWYYRSNFLVVMTDDHSCRIGRNIVSSEFLTMSMTNDLLLIWVDVPLNRI